MFSKKSFILGMLFGLVVLFAAVFSLPDGKLHITFCNVGQGDAAYIKTPNNQDMLIDGGPDNKVLDCLGRHMPFYDRTIDVVVLTHPQKDHLQGLLPVVERYTIKYFVIGVEGNTTEGYQKLVGAIKNRNIPVKNLYTGDKFSLDKVEFDVLWPEKSWVAAHIPTALSNLNNSNVLGISTDTELNDFSYYLDLKYGTFSALFTGDGDIHMQPELMKLGELPQVTILKYPHHGSKTAMLPEFLDQIKPSLSVISVGRNSYGHPTKEALDLLINRAIELKRTDLDGDIEVVSDGKNWIVN